MPSMRSPRRRVVFLLAAASLSVGAACGRILRGEPYPHPDDAVVQGHLIYAPHHVPPIHNDDDYTLFDIDGQGVKLEKIPPLVDMQPGAVVGPGTHRFKVRVAPHLRRPDYVPQVVTFTATVEAGKRYFVVSGGTQPALVEQNPAP